MRITRTENKYPRKEPEEYIGFLGRYSDLLGKRRVLLVPLLLLLAAVIYLLSQQGWLITYGRVMAKEISISSTSISRISEIHVALGDRVEAGQVLVTLNKHSLNAELHRSRVALEKNRIELESLVSRGMTPATRSQLVEAEHQLEQQRLKLDTTQASFTRKVKARDTAKKELAAKKQLLLMDGISSQELQRAEDVSTDLEGQVNIAWRLLKEQEAAVKRAEYALAQAEKNLRFAESGLESEIELKKLEIQRLEQVLADSNVVLADHDLFAPAAGIVTWVNKHPGEVVDHDDVILNVTADGPRWVEAYVYAGDWRKLHNGGRARVGIDNPEGSWLEGCLLMSHPTQRPVDDEFPVGQRLARSPRRLDETIHPVVVLFEQPVANSYPTGSVVEVKLKKDGSTATGHCQSSPPGSAPAD